MKLKNKELEPMLLQLSATITYADKTTEQIGLLHESISLGTKRRLSKILKAAFPLLQQYQADRKEAEDSKDKDKELEELDNEEVTLDVEKVSIAMIESIQTKTNYDWDLIEKIAE